MERILFILSIISVPVLALAGQANETDHQEFMSNLQGQVQEAIEEGRRVESAALSDKYIDLYRSVVSERELRELSQATIEQLYSSGFYALDLSLERRVAESFRGVAREMKRREQTFRHSAANHILNDPDRAILYSYYVLRETNSAARWIERNDMDAVPWSVESEPGSKRVETRRLWSPKPTSSRIRMEVEDIPVEQNRLLIAIVHPHCAPSRRAMNYYESLSSNRSSEALDIVWAIAQRESVPIEPIIRWNDSHDETKMKLLVDMDEWPEDMGDLQTPAFYRIDGHEVTGRVVGWPDDSQADAVHALMGNINAN